MIKVKTHRKFISEGGRLVERKVVAMCDASLLGKVFEEGEMVLDLEKYRSFYNGESASIAEIGKILENATSINLVGKETIAAAGKYLKIEERNIRRIKGVPHLQIYRV